MPRIVSPCSVFSAIKLSIDTDYPKQKIKKGVMLLGSRVLLLRPPDFQPFALIFPCSFAKGGSFALRRKDKTYRWNLGEGLPIAGLELETAYWRNVIVGSRHVDSIGSAENVMSCLRLGLPHSLMALLWMALAAASFPSLGTSTTAMSCRAHTENDHKNNYGNRPGRGNFMSKHCPRRWKTSANSG